MKKLDIVAADSKKAKKILTGRNEQLMEFHVSREIRERCSFNQELFSTSGNVIFTNLKNVRMFSQKLNETVFADTPEKMIKAGQLNAMGLIDEIFHYVCRLYRRQVQKDAFENLFSMLEESIGKKQFEMLLTSFTEEFPPKDVYQEKCTVRDYLAGFDAASGISNKVITLEEMILLKMANENPAFKPFNVLFNDEKLSRTSSYKKFWEVTKDFFKVLPKFGDKNNDFINFLFEPIVYSPNSLKGQLDYIRLYWSALLGEWLKRLLAGIDLISEEEKAAWHGFGGGDLPSMEPYSYDSLMKEYERFSPDKDWMPKVVLLAKTVLVWLDQLSKKYGWQISRLDQIPDEELDLIASEGFTGLWLIGLWERSTASRRIKQICGNPEAAASAYSLEDYNIAGNLGGWDALDNLRRRLWCRGIRLASDMVPNHTGMDAKWIVEKPDLFVQRRDCPFPSYSFNGENLSHDGRVSVYLEDHYYSKNDCAVVFKRVDNYTGDTRYIYHGNDGTGMPWNDTAQIDFLKPEAREAVIQEILHVARNFPIIRFDAAMVLAKKHIRRLWYPQPGCGGDIATRSETGLSDRQFNDAIPNEFWREVVDRVAREVPDTLLLAEAFWMMEGYFVRTLGMHRVYNSAFMNMLKKEENEKYRMTVKNTLEFEPQVLKRFVNFMNNPDEETAVAQFGKGDKYFGVCTLMVTMPGLPMFGHGQIEGFEEKYGMEYQKAYRNEVPDQGLLERHQREIFPLMKKRYLFAEVENFYFYDVWNNGNVNNNVFAYSNCCGEEKAVVFYNNVYQQAVGWINQSCNYAVKDPAGNIIQHTKKLAEALNLSYRDDAYCIFQELRSGLWYIRLSKDLHENGLFVSLNGFETQVLMNMYEVIDDETGKYRVLYETLGGKGVPDIKVALDEIFLKDLYSSFTSFAKGEYFENFALICKPELLKKKQKITSLPLKEFFANIKNDAINFFDTLKRFINGNYGASSVVNLDKTGKIYSSEELYARFEKSITQFMKIKSIAEKNDDSEKDKLAFAKYLYDGLLSEPNLPEIFAGYFILSAVKDALGAKATFNDAKNLIYSWGLDRKLRDCLIDYGITAHDAYVSLRFILEIMPVSSFKLSEEPKETAWHIVKDLFDMPSSRELTGFNCFDNIWWFNKELMESALWYALILIFIQVGKVTDMQTLNKVRTSIAAASKKAEFKASELVKKLEPPKKAALKKTKKADAEKVKVSSAKKPASKSRK